MTIELCEDRIARRFRLDKAKAELRAFAHAWRTLGIPVCLGVAAVFAWLDEHRLAAALAAGSLWLWVLFATLHHIQRLFRNRWQIAEDRIRVRGETWGTIRMRQIVCWSKEAIQDLPGYCLITLCRGDRRPVKIILSEQTFHVKRLDAFLPREAKKSEDVAGKNRN